MQLYKPILSPERQQAELERSNSMMEAFPCLLAIDPSVNNLGWAYFDFSKGEIYDLENWEYGLVHPDGKYIQHKWKNAHARLSKRLPKKPTHFAAEWPTFFSSQVGRIAAQEGYTINLAGMVAFLAGRFQIKGDYISLWTPAQWKGSVPKTATRAKFIRIFGKRGERLAATAADDTIDAIMIAQFWINLYLRQKFSWQHRPDNIYAHAH